ncbi:MAG: dephospho-CoA kinase [Vicinamibacteria bacterium]
MLRVGLTGGIASGKSHVLAQLVARGCHALDLDRVAHALTAAGGRAVPAVIEAFGAGVIGPDGGVDRKALSAVVFADAAARERLNAIVHPLVRAEEARWAAGLDARPDAVVVTDAALLIEAGMHLRFDRLIVVWCPRAEQRRRLMERDGLGAEAAEARLASQMDVEVRRRFAHLEVETSGSHADTRVASERVALALEREAARLQIAAAPPLEGLASALDASGPTGPHGLSAARLAVEIAGAEGLDLSRIQRRLGRRGGPWYAGGGALAEAGLTRWAVPVAAWACRRRGGVGLAAAAVHSLACLLSSSREELADALAAAAVCAEALGAASGPDDGPQALSQRWSGRSGNPGGVPWLPAALGALRGRGGAPGADALRGARALLSEPA